MIESTCPQCGQRCVAEDEWAGKQGPCPFCSHPMTFVPGTVAARNAAPPPLYVAAAFPPSPRMMGPLILPQRISKRSYIGSIAAGTVLGVILIIAGYAIIVPAAIHQAEQSSQQTMRGPSDPYYEGQRDNPKPPGPEFGEAMMAGSLLIGGGWLCLLYGWIIGMILLYKMWNAIRCGPARTTPGEAVGYMFIPFFNVYWMFQAYWGWTKDYNQFVRLRNLKAPPMPEGLALTMCILGLIPFVAIANLLLHPLLLTEGCDGINALAALSSPSHTQA